MNRLFVAGGVLIVLWQWSALGAQANKMAMDNITVQLVFELPGKMGATGLANLEIPFAANVRPTPLQVNSGGSGWWLRRIRHSRANCRTGRARDRHQ